MGVELFGIDIEDPMPLIGLSIWNLIVFLIALVIGFIVVKIVAWSLESSLRKNKVEELVVLFAGKLIRAIGYIVVFAFCMGLLGTVGAQFTAALVGVSVVIGLVLGFSLGDTISNVAAGFMMKPYGKEAGWLEVGLGLAAIACWWWGTVASKLCRHR